MPNVDELLILLPNIKPLMATNPELFMQLRNLYSRLKPGCDIDGDVASSFGIMNAMIDELKVYSDKLQKEGNKNA
jgi:hypothetical protein